MTDTPKVPGLSDDWAPHQLDLLELQRKLCHAMGVPVHLVNPHAAAVDGDGQPLEPVCGSCTKVPGQPGAWDCDPDRPGCPLHTVPEVTR